MTTASGQVIFSMRDVGRVFMKKPVLKGISLGFYYGAKIGVIGLNGSGKSTLLRIMGGFDTEFTGELAFSKGYTVGLLSQEPQLDKTKTVREIVSEAVADTLRLVRDYEDVSAKLGDPAYEAQMEKLLERQGNLQEQIERAGGWDLDSRLELAMDALRCPPPDESVAHLSGGERRRVAMCRLLLQEPDILLLDEPTNHLDAESVHWLERHLKEYKGTVIAVTHDRYFLDNVAAWILELDRGEGIPWKGNYSSWLEQKQRRLAIEEKAESQRQKTLQHELEWIRMAPKARQAKGKARVKAYEELLGEAPEKRQEELEIFIPPGPRLGETVIDIKGLRKGFGESLLIDDFSVTIPRGAIVGIIGPNGAGKTTLFKMIVGKEKPDSGTVTVGETVKFGYVDQDRDALPSDKMVWEAISDGQEQVSLGGRWVNARAYAARFNFTGQHQQKRTGDLSGGERNRVHMARILKSGANVLLLDEPANDLDVNTLRALEVAIENFAGCVLVISHDRWFLDRIATHLLAFEGDSRVVWFEGNFSDYEEDRRRRLGDAADRPHRIQYQKLRR
ncbi:MAG: energy-dependent translational throttle protein EttA [Nitrospirae bacterium]|nr:energy-dependent translational throttle protein EttA [Nitrospirota bacterium]